MSAAQIRLAVAADAPVIVDMLARLADDLGDGDAFSSSADIILKNGFGEIPLFYVLLAQSQGQAVGLALFFAHFSTTKGLPGVYIQDLWIDPETRSGGVGKDLLVATANFSAKTWGAGFMKLAVHTDNPDAERFYTHLDFTASTNETPMIADVDAFRALRGYA